MTCFDLPNKKGKLAACLVVKRGIQRRLIKLRIWGSSVSEKKNDELETCSLEGSLVPYEHL